ncbi:uncharacterized protein Z519_00814 [Cladophialophora bantiana CBS 173.52]|uniref:Peptidase A2 domain-containing protein n=1 Tax=Cladophialophora bantiana (strain ATCC 10958 / CBS 173.52 / CDC B-1940 / NIH 8579) TaxID=1442370 RepID=A0A0D2FAK5_CLAB1|nr:uncharacterized protein Z519_00814 [Cladophialophora bantiana CBS 173.52]KIW99151.1 hypothetical protein Z519_00814 [Cladophialophora bantiana CBS 173.52]
MTETHFELASEPKCNASKEDDMDNLVFVEKVQYARLSKHLPPIPHRPEWQTEGSTRPNGRRSKFKCGVRIILKESEVVSCPDTGSEQNILSKETATQLGILDRLDSSRSSRSILGNGIGAQFLGTVDMELHFPQGPKMLPKCTFHMFESLIRLAILGSVFPRHTEPLTKHCQLRLHERPVQISSLLQVMHVDAARERFRCYMDNNLVDADVDTGSEMDLVSKQSVRKSSQRVRALQDRRLVEFADGSIGWISYQIFARFSCDLERPRSE